MVLKNFTIESEKRVIEAMKKIDDSGIGLAIVTDDYGRVCGTISDGDIRKTILTGIDVNEQKVFEIMRKDPILIYEKDLDNEIIVNMAARLLFERNPRGGFIPVLNSEGKMSDLIHFSGFKKENLGGLKKDGEEKALIKNVNRVLVVGGAGYLGSILIRKLLQRGYRARILDSFLFGKESIKQIESHPNLEIIDGDVRNISTISEALDKIDAVINLAAIVGDPACKSKPLDTIETNYLATRTLAEACKYRQINRFLFASTCSVYGKGDSTLTEEAPLNPLSLYAKSKIKSEEGMLGLVDGNFSPCMMRMGTLYGLSHRMRFDLVVNTLTMKAVTENKISIFGGDQWRPFLHVDDAAEAYIKCLETPIEKIRGQIFNVGSNEQNCQIHKIGSLVKEIIPGVEIEITDKEIVGGQMDKRDYNVSFNKIQKILNFYPTKRIEEGIFEIKKAIENGEIQDVKNKKYYNLEGS